MFPFVFKLWRYHGLPAADAVPDIVRAQPAAPASPVASSAESETDGYRMHAELLRVWQERYLPRAWGPPRPGAGHVPRVILAVDDGSPGFEGVLRTAAFLAKAWEADVVESPVLTSPGEILKMVLQEGADWIVIGHASQNEKERVILGSLAEAVVQEAECPVLVDRGGSLAGGVRKILIPVDGTAASLTPVAEGLRWARVSGAELLILHVEEGDAEKETEHRAYLEILESVRWQTTAHETRTGRGTVPDAILATARKEHAELILMGTHREKTGGELLPQSYAIEVMRRSEAAVMVLYPRA